VTTVRGDARDVLAPEQKERLEGLCRQAETVGEPLEFERWASYMLGWMWEERWQAKRAGQPNWAFGIGAPIVRQIARIGGDGALGLLRTFAWLDGDGRLAWLCHELAADLNSATVPEWATELPFCEIRGAMVARRAGQGSAVMIDCHRGSRYQAHSINIMIDDRQGGIAKRGALGVSFAEMRERGFSASDGRDLGWEPIELTEAADLIKEAVDLTDSRRHPTVGEDFTGVRALALARIRPFTHQATDAPIAV
jgi:hypothetical protein